MHPTCSIEGMEVTGIVTGLYCTYVHYTRKNTPRAAAPPTPPSGAPAVVRCLSPGPVLPGGTVSAVRLPAWRPARRPAAGTRARLGGGPVTSAAQGVQSRRCCGKIAFEFPIRRFLEV